MPPKKLSLPFGCSMMCNRNGHEYETIHYIYSAYYLKKCQHFKKVELRIKRIIPTRFTYELQFIPQAI